MMKYLASLLLAAPVVALQKLKAEKPAANDRGLRNGKSSSSSSTCYTNDGYAWVNEKITDGTCPYVPPSYIWTAQGGPDGYIAHCSASGGFNIMSFVDDITQAVACCDLCALDDVAMDFLAEECTFVPRGTNTDYDALCNEESPYAQGLVVYVGDTATGFDAYCCGPVFL